MPVNLSIKNVPDLLAETLRTRAERNHRSLQGELMAILEQAVQARPAPEETVTAGIRKLSIEEVADHARKLFPGGTPSSTEDIRAMRDGRSGEDRAHTGRRSSSE